jgi:hypothetical protein
VPKDGWVACINSAGISKPVAYGEGEMIQMLFGSKLGIAIFIVSALLTAAVILGYGMSLGHELRA